MPLNPAPPDDLAGLVDAFTQTARAVLDLGRTCREEDFATPTDCPGWTVKDQISHVVGGELAMTDATPPHVEVPDYPWLRSDRARAIEVPVEARRPTSGPDVVHELEAVLDHRIATLARPDTSLDDLVPSPLGPMPLGEILPTRVLDVWTHEQDIRHALGRPGNLDSPGAAIFVSTLFRLLPRIVAKDAGIEPGHSVILDLTGPVVGRAGVRVEAGEGKPVGMPLFSGQGHDTRPGEESTTITLSTDAACRRAAGRVDVDDLHYTVSGDEEIARRVLEALPFTP